MDQNICLNCGTPLDRPGTPCPFCGAPEMKSCTPKLHPLLSSAFSLLRESEFDKAKTAFEAILKQDCESAPAYWGRLRARYHISYTRTVEEKFVPRSATRSAAKLADDIDYRSAMLYANEATKEFLGAQAEYLNTFCTAPDVGASKNITRQFTVGEVDPNDGMTGKSDNPRYTLKIKKYSDGSYGVVGIKLRDKTVTRVVIPYACDGKAVTVVHQKAFRNQATLTEIVVPDSVTVIGNAAFQGCDSLEKLTLPFIGYSATEAIDVHFGYVFGAPNGPEQSPYIPKSLKTVVITGGNTISTSAFNGCKNLTSIEISEGIKSIGMSAFYGCSSLRSRTVPDGVTSIGKWAFTSCRRLTGISIPDGVTSISVQAFCGCSSLTTITIPESVTSIGYEAFFYCNSLTNITFGGTKAQWKAIKRGKEWDENTGNYTVKCTDGTLAKNES